MNLYDWIVTFHDDFSHAGISTKMIEGKGNVDAALVEFHALMVRDSYTDMDYGVIAVVRSDFKMVKRET